MLRKILPYALLALLALPAYGAYKMWENTQCPEREIYEEIKKKVRADLKSPSSAIFPPFEEFAKPIAEGFCAFNVAGDVEAQNSFGAFIRTPVIGSAVDTVDGIKVEVMVVPN